MEGLLNAFGGSAFWPVVVTVLPLLAGGIWLRRLGRRRARSLERVRGRARALRDLSAGEVLITGRFTRLSEERALIEEEDGRAVIERGPHAPKVADGSVVWVRGLATDQVDDPRPGGYRASARVWLIDARERGALIAVGPSGIERAIARAGRLGTVGALLFAIGVAVAVASSVIAWRADLQADDPAPFADSAE